MRGISFMFAVFGTSPCIGVGDTITERAVPDPDASPHTTLRESEHTYGTHTVHTRQAQPPGESTLIGF